MALTGALSLLAPALGSARAFAEGPVDGPGGPSTGDPGGDTGDPAPVAGADPSDESGAITAFEALPMVDGMACEADFAIAKVYARDGLRPQFGMLALEKYARFVDGIAREITGKKDVTEKPELEPWDVRLERATQGVDPTIADVTADLGDDKSIGEDFWYPFLVVDSMPATLLAAPEVGDLAAGSGLDVASLAGSASTGIASELSEPKPPLDEFDESEGTESEFIDEVLHPWAVGTLGLQPEDVTGYAALLLQDTRTDGDPSVGLEGVRLRIPVRAQDLRETPFDDHYDVVYGEEGLFAELGEKKDEELEPPEDSAFGGPGGPFAEPEETVPFPGRVRGTIVVDLEVIDPGVVFDADGDDGEMTSSICVLAGVARFQPSRGGADGSGEDLDAGPVPTSVPSGEGPSERIPGLAFGIGLTAVGAAAVRRRLASRPETVAPVG